MRIWHISDTHGNHGQLTIPENINVVIHSGDFSNYKDYYRNLPECNSFLDWYEQIEVPIKILVAGNHDAVPAKIGKKAFFELCAKRGIIYLENDYYDLNGFKIFGTPLQPNFNEWHFQKARHKLERYWKLIEDDTDILIVHGPPKGILDLSEDSSHKIEQCGCKALRNEIYNRLNLKLCLFGHIHDNGLFKNRGIYHDQLKGTIFSNASVVHDNNMGVISSNGNIIEI